MEALATQAKAAEKRTYTVKEISQMLGISEKSSYRLLKENRIEHFKVGRTYKIPKLHIFNYLRVVGRA